MVRVTGFEPAASCSQRPPLNFFGLFMLVYSAFHSIPITLWRSCFRCFRVFRRCLWSNMGSKTLPDQGRQDLSAPAGKRFSVREVTQVPAVAERHPLPPAYPEPVDCHTIFCGTSCPWKIVRRRHAPMRKQTLRLQAGGGFSPYDGLCACAVYGSNCGLCSIVLTP